MKRKASVNGAVSGVISPSAPKRRKAMPAAQKRFLGECYKAALDKKAEDIVVLDLRGISSIADFFMICSGGSDRHVNAISDNIEIAFKKGGGKYYNVEGKGTSSWVLLDFSDMVVHVFNGSTRAYYALENLWSDAKRMDAGEILAWG
jgi:ribosome-associated protein